MQSNNTCDHTSRQENVSTAYRSMPPVVLGCEVNGQNNMACVIMISTPPPPLPHAHRTCFSLVLYISGRPPRRRVRVPVGVLYPRVARVSNAAQRGHRVHGRREFGNCGGNGYHRGGGEGGHARTFCEHTGNNGPMLYINCGNEIGS